jgi:hypothetical protein
MEKQTVYTLSKEVCDTITEECSEEIDILLFALDNELKKELKNELSISLISEAFVSNYNLLSILRWKKYEQLPNTDRLVTTLNSVEFMMITACVNSKISVSRDLASRVGLSLLKN